MIQAILRKAAEPRPKVRPFYPRDILINLSLANLCCARIWLPLLDADYAAALMNHSPGRVWLLAAMGNVLLLTAVFTGLTTLVRNRPGVFWQRLGRVLFAAGVLCPVAELAWIATKQYAFLQAPLAHIGLRPTLALSAAAGLVMAWMAWKWYAATARLLAMLLIALAPAAALTFGKAILQLRAAGPDPLAAKVLAPPNPNAPRTPHVLWFIFDEWDYRLTFIDRKADLHLPEIDRLLQTTLSASSAVPPGTETMFSIPMLLSGERYSELKLVGGDHFVGRAYNGPANVNAWSRQTVFSDARALGLNTALVGWYLPYCRLFPGELSGCEWMPIERPENSVREDTVPHAMLDEARTVFETTQFSPFGNPLAAERHIDSYRRLLSRALEFSTDPTRNLVFAHLPVPHYPFIYDRKTGGFSRSLSFSATRYYDGLALLDRTIGEIRRTLEAAGQWDDSTILFSSDHFFRWADRLTGRHHVRVPFMLKLPRQSSAAQYSSRFNTISSRKMIDAILRGEIQTPEQAIAWLNRNANVEETVNSVVD